MVIACPREAGEHSLLAGLVEDLTATEGETLQRLVKREFVKTWVKLKDYEYHSDQNPYKIIWKESNYSSQCIV